MSHLSGAYANPGYRKTGLLIGIRGPKRLKRALNSITGGFAHLYDIGTALFFGFYVS
jgi:hypothetical protein